jgi:hypothetical protein
MSNARLTWLTVHRVRFDRPVDAKTGGIAGPARAALTLIGPDSRLDASGLRESFSDVWGGIAFYEDRAAAEAALDDPATLPDCAAAVEAWHGLLCPISHRGETAWFGDLKDADRFVPAGRDHDPGGRLVVLTSAGFNDLPRDQLMADMPRRIDFLRNVDRVVDWYATLPTNLARANFSVRAMGHIDGLTVSVWESDEAMTAAAYKPGVHRVQIDRYKTEHTADRSSFTRCRLLQAKGSWDGVVLV